MYLLLFPLSLHSPHFIRNLTYYTLKINSRTVNIRADHFLARSVFDTSMYFRGWVASLFQLV